MASINKLSVREEIDRIQKEFDQLSAINKISTESKVLFHSMLMLINLLISIFLERITKKDSKNSNKPSSQTEKDESSVTRQGTNGKGKLESIATAYNTRTIEGATIISGPVGSEC